MLMTTKNDSRERPQKLCHKCSSTDPLLVEAERGSFGSGNVIPLSGFTIFSSVKVDRYICMKCGYGEEQISSPADR